VKEGVKGDKRKLDKEVIKKKGKKLKIF